MVYRLCSYFLWNSSNLKLLLLLLLLLLFCWCSCWHRSSHATSGSALQKVLPGEWCVELWCRSLRDIFARQKAILWLPSTTGMFCIVAATRYWYRPWIHILRKENLHVSMYDWWWRWRRNVSFSLSLHLYLSSPHLHFLLTLTFGL